jgi:hypothetical protein
MVCRRKPAVYLTKRELAATAWVSTTRPSPRQALHTDRPVGRVSRAGGCYFTLFTMTGLAMPSTLILWTPHDSKITTLGSYAERYS